MKSKTYMRSGLMLLLALLVLAGPALAESAAYQKGHEDGKAFGVRSATKKGYHDGYKAGYDAGHKKGLVDAELGVTQPPSEIVPPRTAGAVHEAPETAEEAPKAPEASVETAEEEALREYPDLMDPRAPELPGTTGSVESSEGRTNPLDGLVTDEDMQKGAEYSKGFAVGYAEAYKDHYNAERDRGYPIGYKEGYDRAQTEYKKMRFGEDGNKLSAEQQFQLGKQHLLLGKFEKAIERFNLVIEAEVNSDWVDDALYGKASALYQLHRYLESIQTARLIIKGYHDSDLTDDAWFIVGSCNEYRKTGGFLGMGGKTHMAEAAEAYYTVIAQHPSSPILPDAWFRLGCCHESLKDKVSAIDCYKKVINLYPTSAASFRAKRRLRALGERRF